MLVRELLANQHPDLAPLPLAYAASGWDNDTFRLGDSRAVRLPRREAAAALILHEQRWLPVVAEALPVAAPVPVRHGIPSARFPWPWSVVPWLRGEPAGTSGLPADEAPALAAFLRALHRPAAHDAPSNPLRGVALVERATDFAARWRRLSAFLARDAELLERIWREALDAPRSPERVWLHGDLHPHNMLIEAGHLAAVIDWGDLCAGDPATDLASVWMLFAGENARRQVFEQYGANEALRRRARGWALLLALALLEAEWNGSHLGSGEIARNTLARIVERR